MSAGGWSGRREGGPWVEVGEGRVHDIGGACQASQPTNIPSSPASLLPPVDYSSGLRNIWIFLNGLILPSRANSQRAEGGWARPEPLQRPATACNDLATSSHSPRPCLGSLKTDLLPPVALWASKHLSYPTNMLRYLLRHPRPTPESHGRICTSRKPHKQLELWGIYLAEIEALGMADWVVQLSRPLHSPENEPAPASRNPGSPMKAFSPKRRKHIITSLVMGEYLYLRRSTLQHRRRFQTWGKPGCKHRLGWKRPSLDSMEGI
ncbi:uncharacterized protein BDR25DRAFT_362702 [Lindgomyces ingoldianus]|uniref:Uncharacterized protein n=1 Tax=Lindgomyces ingoldianus TaxID=673940 RepID=A0ACB6Q9A5_9PLEO|nr:uncharacterized protein BDR25DRAFT_362702 [Lindgomyces ingoldianus]KAF2463534.1 hypothetical protein BDR25DRAFT_362702 [Lindgomyces ingoldianus]